MSVGSQSEGGEFDLVNPLGSFVDVVHRVALHPIRFFAEVPRRGNLLNPLLFVPICGEIPPILGGLLSLAGIGGTRGFEAFLNPAGGLTRNFGVVAALIVTPIIDAISLFVGAGILHLATRVIVGAGGNSGLGHLPGTALRKRPGPCPSDTAHSAEPYWLT